MTHSAAAVRRAAVGSGGRETAIGQFAGPKCTAPERNNTPSASLCGSPARCGFITNNASAGVGIITRMGDARDGDWGVGTGEVSVLSAAAWDGGKPRTATE